MGVFKMLIYVQKISGRMQKKKKIIVFALQGREGKWYLGHFYFPLHIIYFSISMYYTVIIKQGILRS